MNDELRTLLMILAVSLPIGLAVGVMIRKFRPDLTKSWAKFCLNGQWKLFAAAAVMFGVFAGVSFAQSQPYIGTLLAAFCVLELFALFSFGFKKLSPDMEKRIDESDPTRLWPLRFWKS